MESMDRFAETAKIRGTKGSNLVSGTIISVAHATQHANIVIKIRPLRTPAAKIRRNDAEIFDRPSSASNICSPKRCIAIKPVEERISPV